MCVDHTHRIQSCKIGTYGSRNDKTIVKFDGFVTDIHYKRKFDQETFQLQNADNSWITEKGLYNS